MTAGVIGALMATALSFLSPVQYRADAQVYILSHSRYGIDPYTVAKSAERIGENLAQVMKTSDFFDKVMANQNLALDKNYFQNISDRKRLKRWGKTVDASVVFGTGVLNVAAYHKSPEQAKLYASALIETLVNKGSEYVVDEVTIKVVNQPIVSNLPVRPNFIMNAAVGFVLGMIIMSFLVMHWHMRRSRVE